jgi:UTP--glucose-1-phosphate uridylyltransferase
VKIDADNKVLGIIEKPTLQEAEPYKIGDNCFSIAGLLVLRSKVLDYIEKTKPGKDNEIWLTDSVELMRRDGQEIYALVFEETRYDIGTFESLKEADRLE